MWKSIIQASKCAVNSEKESEEQEVEIDREKGRQELGQNDGFRLDF